MTGYAETQRSNNISNKRFVSSAALKFLLWGTFDANLHTFLQKVNNVIKSQWPLPEKQIS